MVGCVNPEEDYLTLGELLVCSVLSNECDGRTSGRGRASGGRPPVSENGVEVKP